MTYIVLDFLQIRNEYIFEFLLEWLGGDAGYCEIVKLAERAWKMTTPAPTVHHTPILIVWMTVVFAPIQVHFQC